MSSTSLFAPESDPLPSCLSQVRSLSAQDRLLFARFLNDLLKQKVFENDQIALLENQISDCLHKTETESRAASILHVLSCLPKFPHSIHRVSSTPDIVSVLLDVILAMGTMDFSVALLELHDWEDRNSARRLDVDLEKLLFLRDLLDLGQIVDRKALTEFTPIWQKWFESGKSAPLIDTRDIKSLEFWLNLFAEPRLDHTGTAQVIKRLFESLFQKVEPILLPVVSRSIMLKVSYWGVELRDIPGFPFDQPTSDWDWLSTALRPYFHHLYDYLEKDPTNADLRWEVMGYGWRCYIYRCGDLVHDQRKTLFDSAQKALGSLRPIVRCTEAATHLQVFREFMILRDRDLVNCLALFGNAWQATKSLLLLLRAIDTPTVTSDLRYWPDRRLNEELPDPWHRIPMRIASILHGFLGSEVAADEKLERFRNEFATFCFDRLKTRKGIDRAKGQTYRNVDFVEPDPVWRECYIRAIRALRVNPKGRSHHILFFSRNQDPEEQVKTAARTTYKEIRQSASIPSGQSPRRLIFMAFWWLRQAHYVSLRGLASLNREKAQRALATEVRRTTEQTYIASPARRA